MMGDVESLVPLFWRRKLE